MCKLTDWLHQSKALAQCLEEKRALSARIEMMEVDNERLAREVERALQMYADAAKQVEPLRQIIRLMERGPQTPLGTRRVLTLAVLDRLLRERFGEMWDNCGTRMFSDSDWLVGPQRDLNDYLDYFSMFWLPKIKPCTVIEHTKLDGTTVRLWARDCDDFSDFLQGVATLHLDYTPLPWGVMWAHVEGLAISGYHAFNFHVTCSDDFDEVSTAGLHLWLIEPQTGGAWTVSTGRDGADVRRAGIERAIAREVGAPGAGFSVTHIGAVKV